MATVLINKSSGLAESLPEDQAYQAASDQGSHEVPLVDPQGDLAQAPFAKAQELVSQGYSQPSPEQLDLLLKHAKYSSTGQQVKTALEGAAQAATFGGSTAVERAYGVKPEDIRGRREANPVEHGLGQIGGLAASALIPGMGEANLLKGAGEAVAGAAGLAGATSVAARVGSAAVKGAVETALFQGGDEVSKMISQDPNQSVQTAVADIGLGALLGAGTGGAFGAASPLWKAANESKLAGMLSAIRSKANMSEGALAESPAELLAGRAGMELSPEIQAAVSKDPHAARMFQDLMERSGTAAGRKLQDATEAFHADTRKAVLSALGKSEEDMAAAGSASDFEHGQLAQKALNSEVRAVTDPVSAKFEKWKQELAGSELDDAFKAKLQQKIGEIAEQEGLHSFPDTEQAKLVSKFLAGSQNLRTFEDLAKAQTLIGQETQNPALWNIGRKLKGAFRDLEDQKTVEILGERAPQSIAEHSLARAAYKENMDLIEALNDRLHVGSYAGPKSFLTKLGEMKPEDVLRRLSSKNDAGILDVLSQRFPKTAQLIRDGHVASLMEAGYKKDAVNPSALFRHMNSWSPELRKFALPEGAEQRLSSIKSLIDSIPISKNPSHTAGTFDAMISKAPAGAMALISLLMGHNPATGAILGHLGRVLTSEVPDAIKLATLKFLGSGNPISSEAFKTAVDLIASTIKGEHLLNAAVKAVFKAGRDVLPTRLIPSEKQTERLDRKVKSFKLNPDPLMDVGGKVPHYLPEHGTGLGVVASRATEYLNSIRPSTDKMGPLDPERIPSQTEKAKYQRALQIAEHPVLVMNHIKQGTLTPGDVMTIRTIYPDLYGRMNQKLMEHISGMSAQGQVVPYQTRISLSLFMAQPLDSTLTPQAIVAAQPQSQQQPDQQQGQASAQPSPGKLTAAGGRGLEKMSQMAMTPLQAKDAHQRMHG